MKTIFSFSLPNVANTLLLCAFLMLSCSDDDEPSAAPPEVASISPNEGPKATLVTINGTNFGTTLAENEVTFNGKTGDHYSSFGDSAHGERTTCRRQWPNRCKIQWPQCYKSTRLLLFIGR